MNTFSLYLIRHAESENNAKPVHERVPDPGLTRYGRLQADCLAEWMQTLPLDVLVSSPFRRTLATALPILARRKFPVQVWHDIFENGGCYHGHDPASFVGAAGMNREQIESFLVPQSALIGAGSTRENNRSTSDSSSLDSTERGSDLPLAVDPEIGDEGWWNGKPREDIEATRVRAAGVAARLTDTFAETDQHVALLIHADFKRELLRVLLRDILCLDHVGPIANTSVTILRYRGEGVWHLHSLASVTHLPRRLITGHE